MATTLTSTGITFPDATTQTTAAGAVTTAAVLNATAGLTAGGVGTYMWAYNGGTGRTFGATFTGPMTAAMYQQYGNWYVSYGGSGTQSGTWRWLGNNYGTVGLMVRIS